MHTLATLPDPECVPLAAIARVRTVSAARLAEGHEPHGLIRYLWTDRMPDDWAATDAGAAPCPAIDLLAVPEVEVRSDWMAHRPDGVVGHAPAYPAYVRSFYEGGAIDLFGYPSVRKRRRVRRPVYVVTHFNMRTYGHFLLEVLPKLLLVERLYTMGQAHPVAFPRSQPGLLAIAQAACPGVDWLIYDDAKEVLELPLALLPTMTMSAGAQQHDLAMAMIRLLAFRLGRGGEARRRLFLVREGLPSFRVLDNEAALREVAAASHVVGEFASALHNTLFCPASAKVVGLNWFANVQSAIAAAAGHEIGYIMPEGGYRTTFQVGWTEPQLYTIDPALLRERLEQLGLTRV